MSMHDRQAMLLEVSQQILHSSRISKAELQFGSLRHEEAEIPDRPGILGDQGVVPTGVERNHVARPYPSFEGVAKRESKPASLQGQEYRNHPIRRVTPHVEARVDDPAGWSRRNAGSIDGFPPPDIRPQMPRPSCLGPRESDVGSGLFDVDPIDRQTQVRRVARWSAGDDEALFRTTRRVEPQVLSNPLLFGHRSHWSRHIVWCRMVTPCSFTLFLGPLVSLRLCSVARGCRAGDLGAGSPPAESVPEPRPRVPKEEQSDEPEDDSQDYPTDPATTGIGNGDENGLHVNSIPEGRCARLGQSDGQIMSRRTPGGMLALVRWLGRHARSGGRVEMVRQAKRRVTSLAP